MRYEKGGKVDVTLTDGTKIFGATVTYSTWNEATTFCGGKLFLQFEDGSLSALIRSVDSYTPPKPEWDRPEVFAIMDEDGYILRRPVHDGKVWDNQTWHEEDGMSSITTEDLVASGGKFTVVALALAEVK